MDEHDAHGFAPPPVFAIQELPAPEGVLLLELSGEVDLATSGRFREHVEAARQRGTTSVVVDMSEVSFVDSTMLRELLKAHNELAAAGGRFVLAGAQEAVLRLLDLTGTREVFELAESRDAALPEAA
jgi:anti-sigma B factor antagonist